MREQDFTRRIAIVINKDLPSWQILNTLAHVAGYFGHSIGDNFDTDDFFITKDKINLPRNTQYPIIIFSANKQEVAEFASLIQEMDISKMFFIREMIETSNDRKIQNIISQKVARDIEYLGVGIFGPNEAVKSLTGDFELWGEKV